MSATTVAAATNSHSQRSLSYTTRPTQSLSVSLERSETLGKCHGIMKWSSVTLVALSLGEFDSSQ